MDLYGALLAKVLHPAWEQVRGRSTYELMAYLDRTQRQSLDELQAAQAGALRRLIRHAYRHTPFYRARFDAAGVSPEDIRTADDLQRLPLLEKADARTYEQDRIATAPPFATVIKETSGTTGTPLTVRYSQESRLWRDAIRWRGYGWAGYRPGMKAFHYWGVLATPPTGWRKWKVELDHALRRDHYFDCTRRGDDDLARAVAEIRRLKPEVIVAYTQGAAALARYVNRTGSRDWGTIPVICGAERLWPHDRTAMEEAFGPAVFESYGAREFMLIGHECEAHDGLHTSMENLVVELIVRDGHGGIRPARPGEVGELAVTDLHNLSQPMIRYIIGDMALAREPSECACGRTLPRIGPIEGRVTETLRDGRGNAVNGLLMSILFVSIVPHARQFQLLQKKTGDLTLKVVPTRGGGMPPDAEQLAYDFIGKYLPGVKTTIEYLDDIPAGAGGKRHIVAVEK